MDLLCSETILEEYDAFSEVYVMVWEKTEDNMEATEALSECSDDNLQPTEVFLEPTEAFLEPTEASREAILSGISIPDV